MKKLTTGLLSLVLLLLAAIPAIAARHDFVTVPGDPLNTLQYTLPNGLKVFMSRTVPVSRPTSPCASAARTTPPKQPAWPTISST